MKLYYNKKLVQVLKKESIRRLNIFNITDTFTIKIKKPDCNWVAQYRALSQFMNGGRGPIFWLSPELIYDKDEFIISVLHEYGHVIAEHAWVSKNKKICKLISKYYPGKFGSRPWDEEDFAEDFAQGLFGNNCKNFIALHRISKEYIKVYKKPFKLPKIYLFD